MKEKTKTYRVIWQVRDYHLKPYYQDFKMKESAEELKKHLFKAAEEFQKTFKIAPYIDLIEEDEQK